MGETKDLDHKEGLKKLKAIAEDTNTCMMCTNLEKIPFETRPMATQEVDEDGNIWFFSALDSYKNKEILADNRVQLIYSQPSKTHYLTVYGHAKIIKDREKTDELWNIFAKTWFQEGKDDPKLTLLKIVPERVHYWDTQHGKFVTLFKIALGAITGKTMDGGVQGDIRL